jgi:hypothetical protein
MRRGGSLAIAPHRRVGDVLVDGRRWCRLRVHHVTDFVAGLAFVAQWCRAPVDALTVLHNKTSRSRQSKDVYSKNFRLKED